MLQFIALGQRKRAALGLEDQQATLKPDLPPELIAVDSLFRSTWIYAS